jgi:ABC-type branched-subunit amino acid transport system substrate-binding protein
VGADYATLAGLLKAAGTPLLEGVLSTAYLPSVDDATNAWITLFRKLNTQYNSGAGFDGNTEYGFAVGYLFVQALQAAGKSLTRQGIVDAVQKNGFTGPGLSPLRFSATDHSGFSGLQMGKVQGGKQTVFGPVYTTDDGSGAIQQSTPSQPAPPSNGIPAA